MRSIDMHAFEAALGLAGSLPEPARAQLVTFVAQEPSLRVAFGELLDALAERQGVDRASGAGAAMADGLGSTPEDTGAWELRLDGAIAELGLPIVEEALIRFGYAEGAPLSPDGTSIDYGPPASAADRARVLGQPVEEARPLDLDEARHAITAFDYEIIHTISEEMLQPALFLAFARRVVATMAERGMHLSDALTWTEGPTDEPNDLAAQRMSDAALAGTDEGSVLQRQTSKLLGRELRMNLTLAALYDAGYHLDTAQELHRPG